MNYSFLISLLLLIGVDSTEIPADSIWYNLFIETNNHFMSFENSSDFQEQYYDYALELLYERNINTCKSCNYILESDSSLIGISLSKRIIELGTPDNQIRVKSVIDLPSFSTFLLLYNRASHDYTDNFDKASYISSIQELRLDDNYSNIIQFRFNYDLDKYERASSFIREIDLSDIPDHFIRYRLANQFFYTLVTTGELARSLDILIHELIPLSSKIFPDEIALNHKLDQSYILLKLGRYDKSQQILNSILSTSLNAATDLAILNNLALINYNKGKNTKYLEYQLKAEELALELGDYYELLNIYRNLHIFHKYNKNWASALLYLNRAEELINEKEFGNRELSALYRSIGDYYWESERDLSKALSNINYSLDLIDPDNFYYTYISNLQVKYKFLESSGLFEEAKSIQKRIIDLANQKSDQYNYLVANIDLAYLYLINGKHDQAKEILTIIDSYNITELEFISIVKKSYLDIVLNSSERDSNEDLELIVNQIFERAKNSTLSQGGYWNLQKEYSEIFEYTADKLISQNRTDELLALFDRIKTINDASYFNNPLISSNSLSNDDIVYEQKLNDELASLRDQLLTADRDDKASIQANIDRNSAELEKLRARAGNDLKKQSVPYWSLQNTLQRDEALLYFIEINSSLYKTTITKDQTYTKKIALTEKDRAKFDDIAQNLSSKKTDLFQLYDIQQKLALDDIPDYISNITIIPDSYLLQIPIEILPMTVPDESYSFGSTRYLIEDYLVTYYSSIEELYMNSRIDRSQFGKDFSAYGISNFDNITTTSLVPLPYAENELDRINSILGHIEKKEISKTDIATKSRFKSNIPNSRIIHLATHSEVSNEDPIYSTIYFKNDADSLNNEDDGTLYAYELYSLNIQSDLIFLNSCSSGSGNYLQGTGVMGINRALRYAGAKSLLLNLWPVNDNVAASFAEAFYSELAKGLSKPEALRNAKLDQLENGSADPHYWGVYMLMGNPSPVFSDNESPTHAGIYSIIAILLSVILGIGYRQKRSFTL